MKKIVIFVVVLLFITVGVIIVGVGSVKAEDYQESSCNHYVWVEIPGPLGEDAIWLTTDPAVIVTRMGSYNLVGRTFIIGHDDFTLGNVPFNNTWGCYYTGVYYPPQARVDEITQGLNPYECVFVGENGELTINQPVDGTCVLPEPPPPTETSTPTETYTPTLEPTATETPTLEPTETSTSTPEPTETSTPTMEPTETSTPGPTATETPTPTPFPTSPPGPTPDPKLYVEDGCDHHLYMQFPGPSGLVASWLTSDPAVIFNTVDQKVVTNRMLIVAHEDYQLQNVPIENTWGCYYGGPGWYNPPTSITDGQVHEGDSCVFVADDGKITVTDSVAGECFFPNRPIINTFLPLITR